MPKILENLESSGTQAPASRATLLDQQVLQHMEEERLDLERINIRPGVSVLAVLRHLNYKPWFALAEFVDNSIQSYISNKDRLTATEGLGYQLSVRVNIETSEPQRITIRDNAAGIAAGDYARAFRPAELPIDRSGLSEFGMGMKSAACWFAPKWLVRTSALGENVERSVEFDISRIVEDRLEELDIKNRVVPDKQHYTEVILSSLYRPPRTKTISKIREHLTDIYRQFMRQGLIELRFNGEPLSYQEPRVLVAPYHKDKEAGDILWKKDIEFDFGSGLSVKGFAALRERASTKMSGFALFRRNRLIQGSADEGYRPDYIFGSPNSYTYQRLFGELHLEGFEVSHTKDGFRWSENEEPFLELLKEHLNTAPLPLLDQAQNYRVRPQVEDVRPGAEEAAIRTAAAVERDVPPVITRLRQAVEGEQMPDILPDAVLASRREVEVAYKDQKWKVIISLTDDPSVGDWLEVADHNKPGEGGCRVLELRMSLSHPFMVHFGGLEASQIEPLLRVAVAFALGEIIARDSGVRMAKVVRTNANALLSDALWRP